jgi:phenylacetaldehyde dehydrogenase
MQAGIVNVNALSSPDASLPYGGYKQSGWGRERGFEAIELYTEVKAVAINLNN